jgi:hypothetical protein
MPRDLDVRAAVGGVGGAEERVLFHSFRLAPGRLAMLEGRQGQEPRARVAR